jgi:PAS domain S-box-containing protein
MRRLRGGGRILYAFKRMSASEAGAFREAMEARAEVAITRIADRTRQILPFDPIGGEDGLLQALELSYRVWLDALEETGLPALEASIASHCEVLGQLTGEVGAALALIELHAAEMLDGALAALDEGVPGAADGARGVLRALERAIVVYDGAFRARADESAKRALVLRAVAEYSPDGIGIASANGRVTYVNPAFKKMLGTEAAGEGDLSDFVHPEDRAKLPKIGQHAVEFGKWEGTLRYVRADGTTFNVHLTAFRVISPSGEVTARCGLMRDLTDEERSQEERRALEEKIVAAQDEALRELGTPLMPLAEGVLAMPIVGTIDPARAARIIEVMLEGVTRTGAGHVIMDITGVPVVTADVADAIARAAKAAQLVGAEVVLTGIRGAVAKTMLDLGVDLGGVDTWSTLRAGIAHAIAHERQKARGRA